jgi:broad specificity phosphatase PhoE
MCKMMMQLWRLSSIFQIVISIVTDMSPSKTTADGFSSGSSSSILTVIDDEASFEMSTLSTTTATPRRKQIFGIRHGRSLANEYMSLPGNEWGDSTFRDDTGLKDALLSPAGMDQTCRLSQALLSKDGNLEIYSSTNNHTKQHFSINEIDLVLVSPFSRCIQTWEYGLLPAFREYRCNTMPNVLCLPILRERVYTASDTGRSLMELRKEFKTASIDWDKSIAIHTSGYGLPTDQNKKSLAKETNSVDVWWYTVEGNNEDDDVGSLYSEWRPSGDGQYYAVPGEPEFVFQKRMSLLRDFLHQRPEQNILLVTHWAVLQSFTGEDVDNCACVKISINEPQHPFLFDD